MALIPTDLLLTSGAGLRSNVLATSLEHRARVQNCASGWKQIASIERKHSESEPEIHQYL